MIEELYNAGRMGEKKLVPVPTREDVTKAAKM
jgi:hypothetical protein